MRSPDIIEKTLLLVMLTALLPALCIIVYSGAQDIARSTALMREEGAEPVRAVAFRRQSITENMRTLLIAVSHFEEIQMVRLTSARAIFRTILQQTPYFSSLLLTRPDGVILASALPSGGLPVDTAFLSPAKDRNGLFVGRAVHNARFGREILPFTYPITNPSGDVTGLILDGLRPTLIPPFPARRNCRTAPFSG